MRATLIEDLQRLPPTIDATAGGEAEQKSHRRAERAHERIRLELNNGDEYPCCCIACRRGGDGRRRLRSGQRLLTVQVGDTRGYLFTDGELIQLCPDEDNIEYLVRLGC